jgi:hypothetical protein
MIFQISIKQTNNVNIRLKRDLSTCCINKQQGVHGKKSMGSFKFSEIEIEEGLNVRRTVFHLCLLFSKK